MANEGSTKPTYSELERLAKAATPGPWGWYRSDPNWLGAWCLETQSFSPTLNVEAVEASDEDRAFIAAANPQTILDLLAELARVRGLLQRLEWSSANGDGYAMCPVCEAEGPVANCPADPHEPDCWLAKELSQGAESADIGKLDSVDEAGLQMWAAVEMFEDDWDEPRPLWEDLPEADRNSYIKMAGAALRVFKVSQMSPKELDETLAGSAETGGEKAAPDGYCKCGHHFIWHAIKVGEDGRCLECDCANFRQSTETESASSGVEGAHEGTTADKSESREPEKLNNAPDPLDYFLVTYGFDGNNHARQMLISCWAAARQYERKQAAESSLSSPPPDIPIRIHSKECEWWKPGSGSCGCPLAASPELLPTQLPKERK